MEKGYGQAKNLFQGMQATHGACVSEGNPHYVPSPQGVSCDPEPTICLYAAVSGTRRSGLSSLEYVPPDELEANYLIY
jgi:hypothetical protein